jgi:transketolase
MRNALLKMVYELAPKDERLLYIGSDLSPGLLSAMREEFPGRFFMEGISEANIIGMASGLAMEGYIPYVMTIGTFVTRRCYEQIAVDVCLPDLPVRLIGIGGGLNYAPLGPTHQAIEDIAIMRALPNMTIVAPCDAEEMRRLMPLTLKWEGPIYIRLAKGNDPIISKAENGFAIGRAIHMRTAAQAKDRLLFVATGVMTTQALGAAQTLAEDGIECDVLHMHTVKPLDTSALMSLASGARMIVTMEEHTLMGGLGSACLQALSAGYPKGGIPPVKCIGIPDEFPEEYGTQETLMEYYGLRANQIARKVKDWMEEL